MRTLLAQRHGISPSQVIVGPGASALLAAAAGLVLNPGERLLLPWPTYPLLARLGRERRVERTAVAIRFSAVGERPADLLVEQLLAAAERQPPAAIALASPNDPTGELLEEGELARLLAGIPPGCWVFLDQALLDYAQQPAAGVALLADHPRLLLFRTFSKAYGLAGLRIGYLLASEEGAQAVAAAEPALGVNGLAVAGAIEAVEGLEEVVAGRARQVAAERRFLAAQLRRRGFAVQEGEGPFLWASHPHGAAIAAALRGRRVRVADGRALGFPNQLRISCFERQALQRFLDVLDSVLAEVATRQSP